MKLTATFLPQTLRVSIRPPSVSVGTGTPVAREYVDIDTYTGEYSAAPSEVAQTIPVKNLRMAHNFVVEPIPNNYGLITWDGTTITVS